MIAEVLSGRRPPQQGLNLHREILIINYEILKDWVPYLISLRPQVVMFDEAHYIQNRESQRYLALRELVREAHVPYRIAMSGTPITNRPAELWTTAHLLWPKEFPSFIEYGFTYCHPKLVHGEWHFSGAVHLDELHDRLEKLGMIRLLKKDVMPELPPKIRRVVPVEIEDRKEYEYARDHFMPWLQLNYPTRVWRARKNPHLVKVGYLLRLVARLKRWEVADWIDNFLAESDEKLVAFSSHSKMIHWLAHRYQDRSVVIDGTVTGIKRHHAVDRFQNTSSIRLALCNPRAGGIGITLAKASNVVYVDFPWTPGTLKQGEDRIHRIGQTKQCFVWFLAARDTIEEKLCRLLQTKQKILDELLDGITTGKDFDLFNELFKPTKPHGRS